MQFSLNDWGPATVLVVALIIIGAVAGAIVAITNPSTLPFADYWQGLIGFAASAGLLGVGRGVMKRPPTVYSSNMTAAASPSATDIEDHDQDAVDRLRQEEDARR